MSYESSKVSKTFWLPKGYKPILTNLVCHFGTNSFPAHHWHCVKSACSWLTHNLWVTQMLCNDVWKRQMIFPFGKLFPAYVLRKWKMWRVLYWGGTLSVQCSCNWEFIKRGILTPQSSYSQHETSRLRRQSCYMSVLLCVVTTEDCKKIVHRSGYHERRLKLWNKYLLQRGYKNV